jgi:hypothetical protein
MRKKWLPLLLVVLALLVTACGPRTPPTPPTPEVAETTIYFTDTGRYATGAEPFEVAVTRLVPASSNLPEAVVLAFFEGPTPEERQQGLEAIKSGFDGLDGLVIEDGIARVYLRGACGSMGATYTIAQPLMKSLHRFDEIHYVKIYGEQGETEEPEGETDSIPFCLEP